MLDVPEETTLDTPSSWERETRRRSSTSTCCLQVRLFSFLLSCFGRAGGWSWVWARAGGKNGVSRRFGSGRDGRESEMAESRSDGDCPTKPSHPLPSLLPLIPSPPAYTPPTLPPHHTLPGREQSFLYQIALSLPFDSPSPAPPRLLALSPHLFQPTHSFYLS